MTEITKSFITNTNCIGWYGNGFARKKKTPLRFDDCMDLSWVWHLLRDPHTRWFLFRVNIILRLMYATEIEHLFNDIVRGHTEAAVHGIRGTVEHVESWMYEIRGFCDFVYGGKCWNFSVSVSVTHIPPINSLWIYFDTDNIFNGYETYDRPNWNLNALGRRGESVICCVAVGQSRTFGCRHSTCRKRTNVCLV